MALQSSNFISVCSNISSNPQTCLKNAGFLIVVQLTILYEYDFPGFMRIVALQEIYFFSYHFFIILTVDRSMIQNKEFLFSYGSKIYFHALHILISSLVSVFQCVFSFIIIIIVGVGHVSNYNLDYMTVNASPFFKVQKISSHCAIKSAYSYQ
jgi:hypothetical protein